jgi:S-adenosylmethionine synthetase
MIEIVNPMHPDKIADRIAGAIVDYCYEQEDDPKVAVEVLIGHGTAHVIVESSVNVPKEKIFEIVERIAGEPVATTYVYAPQDKHLAENQKEGIRCGDNGIFKGCVQDKEEKHLSSIAHKIYEKFPTDGKYILDDGYLVICQSNTPTMDDRVELLSMVLGKSITKFILNPIGEWTGGIDVDSGATNRKLGSDMGKAVTGGGLHGKDLSKADVSLNIYAHLHAPCEISCAIGDKAVTVKREDGDYKIQYADAVEEARKYMKKIGGFEKFAEWGFHS